MPENATIAADQTAVPADPTAMAADPSAMAPEGAAQSIVSQAWDMLVMGGPIVAILIAMSVVALAIILIKLWQFRKGRVMSLGNVRKAVQLKRRDKVLEALACVQGDPNPIARTLTLALRGRIHGGIADEEIKEEVQRFGTHQMELLRSYLRPLEVIGSLAPLLGLFGTVLGMISAFQQMESAGSKVDPSVLSGGIWEALLTTAVGLAVAIPTVAVLNWLERVAERTEAEMSNALTAAFTRDLSRLGIQGGAEGRIADRVGAD